MVKFNHNNDLNHLMDIQDLKRFKIRSFVKNLVDNNPQISSREIYIKIKNNFVIDETMPPLQYIQNIASKFKNEIFGECPKKLSDLTKENLEKKFPNFFRKIIEYKNAKNEDKKILIFQNDFQISLLKRKNLILNIDSTFKYIPSMFYQMCVIHMQVGFRSFPIAFILMSDKLQKSYERVFSYFKDNFDLSIKSAMMDFEKSLRNGFKNTFKGVPILGCLFHYVNSLMKRLKKLGITKYYSSDEKLNLYCRKYFGLVFTNAEEYLESLQLLEKEIELFEGDLKEKLKSFYSYYYKNWASGNKYNHSDICLLDSLMRRTNNVSEAWNSIHARMYIRPHPNLIKLCSKLIDYSNTIELEVANLELYPSKYNKSDPDMDQYSKDLQNIIEQKEFLYQNDVMKFLKAVALINVKICLKKEKEILSMNEKENKERIDEIESMLSDKIECSLFGKTEVENAKNIKKLNTITKFHLAKKNQKNKELRMNEMKKKRKREKYELLLNKEEIEELSKILSAIDEEMSEDVEIDNIHITEENEYISIFEEQDIKIIESENIENNENENLIETENHILIDNDEKDNRTKERRKNVFDESTEIEGKNEAKRKRSNSREIIKKTKKREGNCAAESKETTVERKDSNDSNSIVLYSNDSSNVMNLCRNDVGDNETNNTNTECKLNNHSKSLKLNSKKSVSNKEFWEKGRNDMDTTNIKQLKRKNKNGVMTRKRMNELKNQNN